MAQPQITSPATSTQPSPANGGNSDSDFDQAADALGSRLREESSGLGNEAKEMARDVAGRARETAEGRLSNGKERAARGLGSVADALRHTGQHLRLQDEESLPGYIDRAAEGLESMSGYLRENELSDLVGDIEGFARREPALFVGGAFALGLIGARFLKSSSSGPRKRKESSARTDQLAPISGSGPISGSRESVREDGLGTDGG